MFRLLIIAFFLLLTVPCIGSEIISTNQQFTVTLPDEWVEIPQKTISERLKAISGSENKVNLSYGFQKAGKAAFDLPYIFIEVKNYKHTQKMIEKLVAELSTTKIPKNILKDPTAVKNFNLIKPYFDATSNIVWWSMESEANGVKVKTISAAVLTDKTTILVNCYTTQETFNDLRPLFESFIRNIEVDNSIRYKKSQIGMDFIENMDVAKVTSAALVGAVIAFIYHRKNSEKNV